MGSKESGIFFRLKAVYKKRPKLTIFVGIMLILAIYYLFWANDEETARVISTAKVTKGSVRKVLESTGIVKSQVGAIVKIGARATGTIKEMRVKVGDPVKEGQIIAIIDDREIKTQLEETEAKLGRMEAELKKVLSVYPKQIAEAEAQVRLAEAQSAYSKADKERQRTLYEQHLIAKDTLDLAIREELVNSNQVLSKEAALERLRQEFTLEKIKAERSIEETKSALDTFETRLSYTRVITPITGVVSQVTAQEGETVVAGLQVANLITVLDPTRLEMWVYVDETDIGQVSKGMPVEFRVDAYPQVVFKGEVDQVYPEPEIKDNIVYYQTLVRVSPEDATKLRPEMTTQCQIVVKEKENILVIPNEAIKWVSGEQVVFRIVFGSPEKVIPKLGLAGLYTTEVLKGLKEGDTVATQIVLPGVQTQSAQSKNRTSQPPPGPPRGRR